VLADQRQGANGGSTNRCEPDGERERGGRRRHGNAGEAHGDRDRASSQTWPAPVDPATNQRRRQDASQCPDRVGERDLGSREAEIRGDGVEEHRDTVRLARQRRECSNTARRQDHPAVVKRDGSHDTISHADDRRRFSGVHAQGLSEAPGSPDE
jgi:hypothetical protein